MHPFNLTLIKIFILQRSEQQMVCANVRAFHENPNRIHTELTFINP